MPYFIAIVNINESPTVSLYGTSERIAFRLLYPYVKVEKLSFIPSMPRDQRMYRFVETEKHAVIHMGKLFLKFTTTDNHKRIDDVWKILRNKIVMEYWNFLFASVGLGTFTRDPLPWEPPGSERKIFFPNNGRLTKETSDSVLIALQMLGYTIIKREREIHPENELAKAWDIIFNFFANS